MMKLDIMNNKDPVKPGEVCKWQLVGGKVTRIEKFIPISLVLEKDLKEETIKIVKEVKKEVKEVKSDKWGKKKETKRKKR